MAEDRGWVAAIGGRAVLSGECPPEQTTVITAPALWFILDATLECFRWVFPIRWQR